MALPPTDPSNQERVAVLRTALQTTDVSVLATLPTTEVPADILATLLTHPLEVFREWAWHHGGDGVVEVATIMLWQWRSLPLAVDFATWLGPQAFYESYFYHPDNVPSAANAEFLLRSAACIGYPDLKWAAAANLELLRVALQNPLLDVRYLRRVLGWAQSDSESEEEAVMMTNALASRGQ